MSVHSISQKVFLVTGCSTGIGAALAARLAQEGHVVYAGARSADRVQVDDAARIRPLTLDVGNDAHVAAALHTIAAEHGRLDGLVNNAGFGAMGPLVEMPLEQVRAQFDTNVFAPLNLVQQSIGLLRESKNGLVVNIGSVTGVFSVPFSGAYNSSKAAIHVLSDVLRMELAHCNVHVMTVYPGGVASEFGSNASARLKDTLAPESAYQAAAGHIEKRAAVSSTSSTTPQMFAQRLADAMLQSAPPDKLLIGQGARRLRALRTILPDRARESLLRRVYGLNKLKQTG